MIYAAPVPSTTAWAEKGESAIWRPPGFLTYTSFPIPSSDGPYASVLDLEEKEESDKQDSSFSATKVKDIPAVKDYWQSCYGIFLVGSSLYEEGEKKPCVGERASHNVEDGFSYLSFEDVDATVRLLGSGFVSLLKDGGIRMESFADEERNGGNFANVGILLQSRKEWLFTDLAISAYPPLTSVTLHYTFPLEHIKAIAEHSKLSCMVTDFDKLPVLEALKPSLPHLKSAVVLTAASPLDDAPRTMDLTEWKKRFADLDCRLLTFDEVLNLGRKRPVRPIMKQDPERVFTIVYTSGTTGNPKGVMLTNKNWIAVIRALHIQNPTTLGIEPDFVHICYLPLSHVFERVIEYAAIVHGVRIAYFSRKRELVADDWRAATPSLVLMVPKLATTLLEKIESRLNAQPFLKRLIVRFAVSRKMHSSCKGSIPSFWYDRILGGSRLLRERIFGSPDRMRFAACGGGKLDPAVQEKLEKYLGFNIIQGWGMTETSGAGSWQAYKGDDAYDSVGGPTACLEIKVKSWESYDATVSSPDKNPQGELLVRGDNVFPGYFREKELTKEAFYYDDDGVPDREGMGGNAKESEEKKGETKQKQPWLRTGDVVEIQPNGSIKIIDRKKSLIKLAQGEYLQTEKLENTYGSSSFVENIFVHGYDSQSYPIAIVVPDRRRVLQWAREHYYEKDSSLSRTPRTTASPSVDQTAEEVNHHQKKEHGKDRGYEEKAVDSERRLDQGVKDEDVTEKGEGSKGKADNKTASGVEADGDTWLLEEALRDPELKKEILADFDHIAKATGLLGFEKVKNVFVTADVWTPENGMLTPTFKIKRPLLIKTYKQQMDHLYAELASNQVAQHGNNNTSVSLHNRSIASLSWWRRLLLLPWVRAWLQSQ